MISLSHGQSAIQSSRRGLARHAYAPRQRGHQILIPTDTIEAIRAASPVERIVAEKVRLRQTGAYFVGLCPFHAERTPSFAVHPIKQIYRCFGCGVSGDVFSFVARIERTDFRGAVMHLARRVGIALTHYTTPEQAEHTRRDQKKQVRAAQALADMAFSAWQAACADLHQVLDLRRRAAARLRAIQSGEPVRWPGEPEMAWEALRIVADELSRADTCYCILSFATPAERYLFVLHPERRKEMIEAALDRGYVADARGYRFQVAI